MNSFLIEILGLLHEAALLGEVVPQSAEEAALADKFIQIAQATIKAHQRITGQPLDLSLLKPINPT